MTEQAFVANPIAAAGGRVIASPFQFVSDDDTNLMIVSVCSVTGVTLALQGRRVDETGRVVPFVETHTPRSDRTTKVQFYKLGKGALLNLTVFALTGAATVGQCYVSVRIIQGFTGATVVLGTLLGGYVTTTQALGFPGSVIVSSTDGEPAVRNIVGSAPAAGGSINEVCPAGARWELITVFFVLDTSAVAGVRSALLEVISAGQIVALMEPAIGQNPSTGLQYTFGQNLAIILSGTGAAQAPIPPRMFLRASDSFFITVIGGVPVGDQFLAPNYQVREWLEVA